ncbi:MAG: ABC transporter permease [Bacteroidetes bacterium]|nr:ABC transporter permease [Bacteroidota bacterium]
MNKVWIIIRQEFLNRVQKRTFLIATILVPLIFPAIIGGMFYLMMEEEKASGPSSVFVLDESGKIQLKSNEQIQFTALTGTLEEAKQVYKASESEGLLYVPDFKEENPEGFQLYTEKNLGIEKTGELRNLLSEQIRDIKLRSLQIDPAVLESSKKKVELEVIKILEDGEEERSNNGILNAVGMVMGILIYMMVFLYGAQIMHGVIEEKSSKVIEVLVSTVRPFQLMLGKIIGIASVGLLQFLIWIVLIVSLSSMVTDYFGVASVKPAQIQTMAPGASALADAGENGLKNEDAVKLIQDFENLPVVSLTVVFLFYFLGGYLMYGALFAAVGSSVDSVQEAQQFQFPVTVPLFIGYLGLFTFILRDPHSSISFWLSIIPFTSPVAMVGRVAFGVPAWELGLSMLLLVGGFLGMTWVAGRIYRVGILMTGTKVNWRTLYKWATMKL